MEYLSLELKDVLDWFTLGVNLHVEPSTLEGILDNTRKNQCQRKEDMLAIWLGTHPPDPWETLVRALQMMREEDIGMRIAKMVAVTGLFVTIFESQGDSRLPSGSSTGSGKFTYKHMAKAGY